MKSDPEPGVRFLRITDLYSPFDRDPLHTFPLEGHRRLIGALGHRHMNISIHDTYAFWTLNRTAVFFRTAYARIVVTFDPVHFDGIARIARRIAPAVDEGEQQAIAETVWNDFLDPLLDADGRAVLEPLDDGARTAVDITGIAAEDPPYPTQHGIDSGTINPTTFKNGLVIDVAQAAMAADPSDLDLHRERTIVTTVHGPGQAIPEREDSLDSGYATSHTLRAPPVSRFEESVVHELALYLAESRHARERIDRVDDLLILDGPIYPKGMLNWADRDPELADLLYDEPQPRDVVTNYVRLVEETVQRDVPLLGVVKNPASRALTRTLTERPNAPDPHWVNDTAFFTRILERVEFVEARDQHGDRVRIRERNDDDLTATGWFRSRGGADRLLAADENALGIPRTLDPADYEVTFFAVYDPRDDLLYRVEAPFAVTCDPDERDRLRRQVLHDVAVERGPPPAVGKADQLARIDRAGTRAIRAEFERVLETDEQSTYDDHRWGLEARGPPDRGR